VYVIGKEVKDDINIEDAIATLDVKADRIEVVSTAFDVMDAWWRFTAKGMAKIICMIAEPGANSKLRFTGRELRLCG
jgi:hypothetical protein